MERTLTLLLCLCLQSKRRVFNSAQGEYILSKDQRVAKGRLISCGTDIDGNDKYNCPMCDGGVLVHKKPKFYTRCDICEATVIVYEPTSYQQEFHASPSLYKLNLGGFGTGKTTACAAEVIAHVLSIPNSRFLLTAITTTQLKDAIIPEIENFLPPWFLEKKKESPNPFYKLTNGSEIICYPSDNEQKIRSLNLTGFLVEEASGVDGSVFKQLKSRLRNKVALLFDDEGNESGAMHTGLVSSNPDEAWFVDDFLLLSGKINASPSVDKSVYEDLKLKKATPQYETFLTSTRDNTHLPKGYIEGLCAGESQQWINRMVDCVLEISEDLVYPRYKDMLCEPFPIPDDWLRVAGYDVGYADPTAFLIGAIEPGSNIVYYYEEYSVAQEPVSHHAKELRRALKGKELYLPVQACPAAFQKSKDFGVKYADTFYTFSGISLQKAESTIISGIEKVREYGTQDRAKIFNSLEQTKRELSKYKYSKSKNGLNNNDKPIDKDNHLMDVLRYTIARLPDDPNKFQAYTGRSHSIVNALGGDLNSNVGTLGNNIYGRKFKL